jgi:DNA-directed RNA polymerase beta subunit
MSFDEKIKTILDAYFSSGGNITASHQLVRHQIESYNDFIENKLRKIVAVYNPIKITNDFNEKINDFNQKISIYVEEPHFTKPIYKKQDGTQITMTPQMARNDNLTYSCDLYVNVRIITYIYNQAENHIETKTKKLKDIYIGKLPVMVGSKACILSIIPHENILSECRYDMGGYFIVNGNEKVLINQDRIKENYVLIFKPANNIDIIHTEIRSMNESLYLPTKTISLSMSKKSNHMGRVIRINTSFLKTEIPVFIMFRALNILSDYEIIHHILYDVNKLKNKHILEELKACCDDAIGVYTREDALEYILRNITGNMRNNKTIENVEMVLDSDLLPHITGKNKKALYLGFMINKAISIYLGYESYDNRDSYINKRIDTPGMLMSNLFRQCYGKITKELKSMIEKDINQWRNDSTSVVDLISDKQHITKYFKQGLLDSWLKYALSTGNWGIKTIGSFQNIKQGVSQVLNRMCHHSTLSHLRRINTAMEKNGKLVQPRKLDNSQYGVICPCETPEGAPVGLVKNMALSTNISMYSCNILIKIILKENNVFEYSDNVEDRIVFLQNILTKYNALIIVNGELFGYHSDPEKLYRDLKSFKRQGLIHPVTAIYWDRLKNILSLSTEGGRMYRPLFIVDNYNELRFHKFIKKYGIEELSKWTFESFIMPSVAGKDEKEGFIEYLDIDETAHSMIAMFPKDLEKEGYGVSLNPRYTHCEIHPSLMFGILGANIPFANHNQAPRNTYQCIWIEEELLMSDGAYKKIKDIKIGDNVITFDINEMITSPTEVVNHWIYEANKPMVTLTTLYDNKKIVCSDDHKFMTLDGWKAPKDFDENTRVGFLCNNIYHKLYYSDNKTPHVLIDEETILNILKKYNIDDSPKYIEELKTMKYIPLMSNDKRLSILAGIFGFILADDITIDNNLSMNIITDTIYDEEHIKSDLYCIGFKEENLNGLLPFFMIALGVLSKTIPDWIKNNDLEVKRHFLAGFQGKNSSFDMIHPTTNLELMYECCDLLNEFGINTIANKIKPTDSNLIRYYDKIGYKYDINKSSNIALDILYLKASNKYKNLKYVEFCKNVIIKGEMIFQQVNIKKHINVMIADIEVKSSNHSFISKDNFACSNSAMGKQALGIYMTNFNSRMDTLSNVLNYPQKSLIATKLSKYTQAAELPSGINAVVAIMTYTGFNQEDGIIVNRDALDRGLFVSTHYKTLKEQCNKNHSTGEEEVFCCPDKVDISKQFNYNKLNKDGFVNKNTFVKAGDIIVGKIMPKKIKGKIHNIDTSVAIKQNEEGIVDLNYNEINNEGYAFCKIRIRNHRKPAVGDKLASSIAQKASIGMIYNSEDMPYTKDGIIPDLIMNPHAIPSRMTIAQLMECVLGKVACIEGNIQDCTPYNELSVEDICNKLESYGMEKHSNEIMYDGYTGRQMKTTIFIGPTYYQRLKHIVADKMHSRSSNGPIVFLTRQPSEGRSRAGGLRVGEMERDAILSHGASLFLKEKILDCSDNSKQYICKICGMIMVSNSERNLYICNYCKNDIDPAQIRIPYAFKLIIQELQAMSIALRISI